MKILNYSNVFFPLAGGIEHNIFYFAKYSKMDHLVLTDLQPYTEGIEDYGHITAHRVPPVKQPFDARKNPLLFALDEIRRERNRKRILKELEFDLLHLRGPYLSSDLNYYLDCLLGRTFFKKYCAWKDSAKTIVSTFHALLSSTKFTSEDEEKSFWLHNERGSWDEFVKFVCSRSEEIICVDHYMIEPLERASGGKTVHYIPSGIDQSVFYPVDQEEARRQVSDRFPAFSEGKRILLVVGRLGQDRGISFLESLADILPDGILIVVVGSGKTVPRSNNIRYLGPVDNSLMPLLFNASDFVFNPVIVEGTSRTGMEAMSCGKPLIMRGRSLDRYPIEDGKNGFVIDDVSEAAGVLDDLESSNTYGRISKNALETSKVFDVRMLSEKVDRIYLSTKT